MKAIEQYFHVVLFIMLHKVVLTFKFVDETLVCDHSKLLRTVPTFVTAHIFYASRKASIALDARAKGICSLKMTNSTSRPSARLKCKKISVATKSS